MKSALKIIVAGEGAVGKTSFLNKYLDDKFDEESKMTKGVDFSCKTLDINNEGCDLSLDLSIWDLGGQERFRFMFDDIVKGSKGAFFMFDLTRTNTLDKVEEWFNLLRENGNIPILLLGSKEDLLEEEQAKLFDEYASEIIEAYENCFDYLKISAKTGQNIEKAFELLVKKITKEDH